MGYCALPESSGLKLRGCASGGKRGGFVLENPCIDQRCLADLVGFIGGGRPKPPPTISAPSLVFANNAINDATVRPMPCHGIEHLVRIFDDNS